MTRGAPVIVAFILLTACSSGPPRGHVSRAELGDSWPLTVDEGVLDCTAGSAPRGVVPKAVTFKTTDGTVYAVNGTAKSRGFADIEAIQKTVPPLFKATPLERLPEPARRAVFAESVQCEDEADRNSMAKYPNPTDFQRQIDLQQKLTEQCKAGLRKRHKVTEDEHKAISQEGGSLGWPPLTPMRANIAPLIERGLLLCEG